MPVWGISLTDPHYLPLLALRSHRAPAVIKGIVTPWSACILLQILQKSMFCSTAGGEESLAPSGHLQTIKDRHSVCKGVDLQKKEKNLASLKEAMSVHDHRERNKHRCQEKTVRNRIPESEMRFLWKHPGLKIQIRNY